MTIMCVRRLQWAPRAGSRWHLVSQVLNIETAAGLKYYRVQARCLAIFQTIRICDEPSPECLQICKSCAQTLDWAPDDVLDPVRPKPKAHHPVIVMMADNGRDSRILFARLSPDGRLMAGKTDITDGAWFVYPLDPLDEGES